METSLNSKLTVALDKVITGICNKLKTKLVGLPTLLDSNDNGKNNAMMVTIADQSIAEFKKCLKSEIQCMFEEENLTEHLDEFAKLLTMEELQSTSGWRPTGNVEEDLRAHLLSAWLQKESNLLQLREETAQQHEKTKQTLLNRRAQLMKSVTAIENGCNEIVSAAKICSN